MVMLFDREGVEHGERIAVVEGWQRQTQGWVAVLGSFS